MNSSTPPEHWRNSALLLVGHGSSRLTTSGQATLRLAGEIRAGGLFSEVKACFWKEEPFLSLDLVDAATVYVVPNFAGEGAYTRRLIPERLGLTGRLTERDGRRIVYCEPVGCHAGVPTLLGRRAEELAAAHGLDLARTALLVIGHGSKGGSASRTPEAVASALRAGARFAQVVTAYIEQEPRVAGWPSLVQAPTVIAAPLLIAEGMHASEDLPPLFGLSAPVGGPAEVAGRRVWLMGGIGRHPEVVAMILDQVRAADAEVARLFP